MNKFISTSLILLILVSICSGCGPQDATRVSIDNVVTTTYSIKRGDIERFVDDEAGVVCYVQTGNRSTSGSIDCLPISDTRLDK